MKYKYFSVALVSKRLRCNSLKLTYYVGIEIKGRWSQCAKTYLNLRYFIEKIFSNSKHTGVTTKTANQMKPSKTTRNHPKPTVTTRNHTKLSETTQTFLQPTSNYPKLPIISLKPPETPNNHPLNAFWPILSSKILEPYSTSFPKLLKNNEYSYFHFYCYCRYYYHYYHYHYGNIRK